MKAAVRADEGAAFFQRTMHRADHRRWRAKHTLRDQTQPGLRVSFSTKRGSEALSQEKKSRETKRI